VEESVIIVPKFISPDFVGVKSSSMITSVNVQDFIGDDFDISGFLISLERMGDDKFKCCLCQINAIQKPSSDSCTGRATLNR
jgi:hypothetical protein